MDPGRITPVNPANIITLCRILMAPVLVALAYARMDRSFLACLACSLVSDIVDGQLARRCNMATALGSKLDSWADFLTALSLAPGLVWLRPECLSPLAPFIGLAVASYLLPIMVGFAKFRSLTSYHTLLARVAAYGSGAAVLVLFAHGPSAFFKVSAGLWLVSGIEEIAITLVLAEPRSNVGSLRRVLAGR